MHLQVNIIGMLGRDPPSSTTVFLFKGRLKALYPGPEDQGHMDPESYSGVEIQLIMLQAQNHSNFLYVVAMHTEGTFPYRQKLSNYPPTSMIFGVVYYCQSLRATLAHTK